MFDDDLYMYFVSFIFYVMTFCGILLIVRLMMLIYSVLSAKSHQRTQSDQNNIYNISGSVQGQNQHAYPDAYLSIDHIAITNELNKPPPKYDDAPPSYEEALKLAMAHSNSLQTYQSEQGHSADLPRTHLPAGSSID
ncbi:uncharacterized protein LOC126742867 isoform X6 [Anthonomus grandis grandis]|uniref:uncharacterized protein LOC126742867 isoform X6 n=1 Tax=Anthonomus grandis grandis TaxID=2921223 RepID=UPI0021659307|nr:uncharacterized protein LOC126742867 isoform X6 [Anthonomus grandis grandis]